MKVSVPILRSVGMTLALAIFGNAARGQAANVPSPAASDAAQSKVALAPEVEKELGELMDKMKARKSEASNWQMKKEIDEIARVTGLSNNGRQILTDAARQAVAASSQTWAPNLPDVVRRQLAGIPKEQAVAMLTQAQDQLGAVMSWSDMSSDSAEPDQQDVWTKALSQALTPAQLAAWTQAQAKHKDDLEKEIADVLKNGADRTRKEQTNEIMSECSSIEGAMKLSADRAAKLEALAKSAVDQVVATWRKREENTLLAMGDDQRRQMLRGSFYLPPQPNESSTEAAVWKDGLSQLLSTEELAQLSAAQDDRKARREHVMGHVLVMLVDEKIALTEAQRQKLEPVADHLVADIPDLYPEGPGHDYLTVSSEVFYAAAAKADDAELKPILDEIQLKRWHDLTKIEIPPGDAPPADPASAPKDGEPEDVEKAVSTFFYEKTEEERQRELNANTLKAEDVARVAGLSPDSTERLEAAAAGATEQSLMTWKWFTEQQVRSQLQGLTPQNVNQRLASLQDFFFQRRFGFSAQQNIWDQTVQTELTPQQLDAWKKETDEREDYRGNTIAAAVLSEFDRQAHLTAEQWNKLNPLVAGVLNEYNQGISQVFSGMNGTPWYLGGPYVLIPLAGVNDQDLKSVLTKDQMDLWTGSQEFANANNLWQIVKQMHGPHGPHGPRVRSVPHKARLMLQN